MKNPIQQFWLQTIRDYFLRVLAFVGAIVIVKYFLHGEVDQDIPPLVLEALLFMLMINWFKLDGIIASYKKAKNDARAISQAESPTEH